MTPVRCRVAFRPLQGTLDPDSIRVEGEAIICDVLIEDTRDEHDRVREVAGLTIDPTSLSVSRGSKVVVLGRQPMAALVCLADQYPRAATKYQLREALGWEKANGCQTRAHDATVSRVSRELAGLVEIRNVWGVGWRLVPMEAACS